MTAGTRTRGSRRTWRPGSPRIRRSRGCPCRLSTPTAGRGRGGPWPRRGAGARGGPGARWHVPRLRAGDPERSSVVTTFLGGASAIRRSAYLEAGGYPDEFFYGHEETDLAWRLLDRVYGLEYDAPARMCHPTLPNARYDTFRRRDGRNRVLLARRNLPWPL